MIVWKSGMGISFLPHITWELMLFSDVGSCQGAIHTVKAT